MSSIEDEILRLARDRLTEAAHLAATAYMKKLRLERVATAVLGGLSSHPDMASSTHEEDAEYCVKAAKALIAEIEKEQP